MISVFFDLDGVLADFVRSAVKVHGQPDYPYKSVKWDFWKGLGVTETDFWAPLGFDFWANLNPHLDGVSLLKLIENVFPKEQISLLTSPCDTDGCLDGKRAWVKRVLPDYYRRLFIGSAKEMFAGPTKILIDDSESNIRKWHAAGGQPLLIPRPWNGLAYQTDENGAFDVESLLRQFQANYRVARSVEP